MPPRRAPRQHRVLLTGLAASAVATVVAVSLLAAISPSSPHGPLRSAPPAPTPGLRGEAATPLPSPTPAALVPVGGFPWMTTASAARAAPGTWHVPVLMYHLVATPAEAGPALPGLVVAPSEFRAEMALLHARGWRTVTAAALASDLLAGHRPPARTVVLTFDDGHEDGYTEVMPVLQQYGFVATFYVITDRIGAAGYLSAAQLKAMAAAGMEIGDHTVHHVALATVSAAVAGAELAGAATAIVADTGVGPTTLAYPYGSYDATAIAVARSLGFAMAFIEGSGCRESFATRLATPRLRVSPSMTPAELLGKMTSCS